jgi:ABC-2 type transport system ATP-binding protein
MGATMNSLVTARGVSKRFGKIHAVDNVSFDIGKGRIMGLIGPNGAGKTTLLKALLGLTDCEGDLSVLGLNPFRQRKELMRNICFIADVAVLPRWIRVSQLLDFVESTHPNFSREKAEALLGNTKVNTRRDARVRELSKGMVTQLHLAIIAAIDARLLVLDEPTLGLDINILTDIMFINEGRIILDASMESLGEDYVELLAAGEKADQARSIGPIAERDVFGKKIMLFEKPDRARLEALGELHTPSVADLFVAKVKGVAA